MQYEAPDTTRAAVDLLAKAKGSAYVLAGGSDLLVRMRGGYIEPDLVVDIKRIKAMREVKKSASGFTIGAAVAAGVRRFRRVVVVSDSEPPAAPCGACRQVIFEFAPDADVLAVGPQSSHRWTMRELLPAAFSGSQLT